MIHHHNIVRKVHSSHLDLNICSQPLMCSPTLSGGATEPRRGFKDITRSSCSTEGPKTEKKETHTNTRIVKY